MTIAGYALTIACVPLLLAGVLAAGGSFRTGFALLAIPGAAALAVLLRLRAAAPDLLVSAHRRGAGYGTFTASYGLGWLAGGELPSARRPSCAPPARVVRTPMTPPTGRWLRRR